MENEQSLDEILSEKPESEATETKEPETIVDPPSGVADPPSERLRDGKGRFAKQDETGVEQPKPKAEAQTTAPPADQSSQLPPQEYAALKDERRKRQEAERRLAALEQQASTPQPVEAPDFWDDPAGFMTHMRQQMRTELLQSLRQEQQIERLNISEAAAKAKHPDYDDAFAAFQQAVQLNPRLAEQLATASDPGEFAYSKGKAALALEQFGSIDQLLAAERQKWEAEVKGHVPTPTLPSTTAADGSVGSRSGPEWGGPPTLKEILG